MRNRFGIAIMTALCMALWGCGGGGGGGEPTVTQTIHDELQADLDAALAELEATEGQRDRARSDVARLTAELATSRASVTQLEGQIGSMDDEASATGSLHAQLNAAKADAAALTAQIGTATDAADASATASLHAQLNAAKADVTRLEGVIGAATADVTRLEGVIGAATDTASTTGSLHAQLNAANANVTRLTRELATANATLTQVRGTQTTATQRLASLQAQLTAAQQQVTTLTAEVTRLRAAGTTTTTDTTGTTGTTGTTPTTPDPLASVRAPLLLPELGIGATDRATAVTVSWPRGGTLQFNAGAYTSGTAAPSVPGSWSRRASFTGQAGTATAVTNETIYLYSNIQGPGGTRAIWKVHGLGPVTMSDTLAMRATGSSATPTTADTDTTTDGRQYTGLKISGSLGGVSGTFTCGTCEGTFGGTSDNVATHVTFPRGQPPAFGTVGSWEFSFPVASHNARYQVDNDDAHLYFGVWDSEPAIATGAPNFRYIAGGGAESGGDLANFGGLTGTATFTGGAVGKYATVGQIGQQSAKIGTFTATAAFTANLGDDTAAGNLHGRLTNFREGGASLAGWGLTLGATGGVGTPADISAAAATGLAVGTMGAVPVSGTWAADFYGSDNASLDNRVLYPVTRYPVADLAGVTGWFEANNDDTTPTTALAGAFGATCSTGPCGR